MSNVLERSAPYQKIFTKTIAGIYHSLLKFGQKIYIATNLFVYLVLLFFPMTLHASKAIDSHAPKTSKTMLQNPP